MATLDIAQELYGPTPGKPRLAKGALAIVAALHGAAIAWLASQVAETPPQPPVLMVRMLAAEQPAPVVPTPPRPPTPVKPETAPTKTQAKPTPRPQVTPSPQLAAQSTAPAAAEVAPPAEKPAPAAAAPVAAAPAPISEPRFDADYLDNPAPAYPPLSRRLGEEGRVVLRVFVEPDGRPSQLQVKTGSGFERLDKAAENAVRRWKFVPARRGQEAVGAWVLVPVVFSLKSPS